MPTLVLNSTFARERLAVFSDVGPCRFGGMMCLMRDMLDERVSVYLDGGDVCVYTPEG